MDFCGFVDVPENTLDPYIAWMWKDYRNTPWETLPGITFASEYPWYTPTFTKTFDSVAQKMYDLSENNSFQDSEWSPEKALDDFNRWHDNWKSIYNIVFDINENPPVLWPHSCFAFVSSANRLLQLLQNGFTSVVDLLNDQKVPEVELSGVFSEPMDIGKSDLRFYNKDAQYSDDQVDALRSRYSAHVNWLKIRDHPIWTKLFYERGTVVRGRAPFSWTVLWTNVLDESFVKDIKERFITYRRTMMTLYEPHESNMLSNSSTIWEMYRQLLTNMDEYDLPVRKAHRDSSTTSALSEYVMLYMSTTLGIHTNVHSANDSLVNIVYPFVDMADGCVLLPKSIQTMLEKSLVDLITSRSEDLEFEKAPFWVQKILINQDRYNQQKEYHLSSSDVFFALVYLMMTTNEVLMSKIPCLYNLVEFYGTRTANGCDRALELVLLAFDLNPLKFQETLCNVLYEWSYSTIKQFNFDQENPLIRQYTAVYLQSILSHIPLTEMHRVLVPRGNIVRVVALKYEPSQRPMFLTNDRWVTSSLGCRIRRLEDSQAMSLWSQWFSAESGIWSHGQFRQSQVPIDLLPSNDSMLLRSFKDCVRSFIRLPVHEHGVLVDDKQAQVTGLESEDSELSDKTLHSLVQQYSPDVYRLDRTLTSLKGELVKPVRVMPIFQEITEETQPLLKVSFEYTASTDTEEPTHTWPLLGSDKIQWGPHKLTRGNIVRFRHPNDPIGFECTRIGLFIGGAYRQGYYDCLPKYGSVLPLLPCATLVGEKNPLSWHSLRREEHNWMGLLQSIPWSCIRALDSTSMFYTPQCSVCIYHERDNMLLESTSQTIEETRQRILDSWREFKVKWDIFKGKPTQYEASYDEANAAVVEWLELWKFTLRELHLDDTDGAPRTSKQSPFLAIFDKDFFQNRILAVRSILSELKIEYERILEEMMKAADKPQELLKVMYEQSMYIQNMISIFISLDVPQTFIDTIRSYSLYLSGFYTESYTNIYNNLKDTITKDTLEQENMRWELQYIPLVFDALQKFVQFKFRNTMNVDVYNILSEWNADFTITEYPIEDITVIFKLELGGTTEAYREIVQCYDIYRLLGYFNMFPVPTLFESNTLYSLDDTIREDDMSNMYRQGLNVLRRLWNSGMKLNNNRIFGFTLDFSVWLQQIINIYLWAFEIKEVESQPKSLGVVFFPDDVEGLWNPRSVYTSSSLIHIDAKQERKENTPLSIGVLDMDYETFRQSLLFTQSLRVDSSVDPSSLENVYRYKHQYLRSGVHPMLPPKIVNRETRRISTVHPKRDHIYSMFLSMFHEQFFTFTGYQCGLPTEVAQELDFEQTMAKYVEGFQEPSEFWKMMIVYAKNAFTKEQNVQIPEEPRQLHLDDLFIPLEQEERPLKRPCEDEDDDEKRRGDIGKQTKKSKPSFAASKEAQTSPSKKTTTSSRPLSKESTKPSKKSSSMPRMPPISGVDVTILKKAKTSKPIENPKRSRKRKRVNSSGGDSDDAQKKTKKRKPIEVSSGEEQSNDDNVSQFMDTEE